MAALRAIMKWNTSKLFASGPGEDSAAENCGSENERKQRSGTNFHIFSLPGLGLLDEMRMSVVLLLLRPDHEGKQKTWCCVCSCRI